MILVTGSTGMLGAHLLFKLIKKGENVKALKRQTSNIKNVKKVFSYFDNDFETMFSKIDWVDGDILDKGGLIEVTKDISQIYHAAAIVSFKTSDRNRMIESNITGTKNLVNAALINKVDKFCHVSSIAALGDSSNGETINEETFRNPKTKRSGYSISKYFSELEVWRGINEGLNAVIVNPSVILGEGDWQNGSSKIFSTIAKKLKYYTRGITGYVDVLDVVEVMVQLMESKISSERFIVSSENLSFKDIFSRIADALDVPSPEKYASPLVLELAWRLEALRGIVTNNQPKLTKSSAKSAQKIALYSAQKLQDRLNFSYNSIDKTISRIANNYKSDFETTK